MNIRIFSQALVSALLVLPGMASATTLHFVGPDQTNVYNMDITGPGAYNGGVYVGSLSFTIDSNPTDVDLYCVDLAHDISSGNSYTVNVIQTDTLQTSNPSMYAAGNIYAASVGSVHNADEAAGLQIALWDTIAPGQFTISGVSSQVQGYVTADLANSTKAGNALWYQENSGTGQSQIGAVPEPTSLAALAIGGLGLLRRRKR